MVSLGRSLQNLIKLHTLELEFNVDQVLINVIQELI